MFSFLMQMYLGLKCQQGEVVNPTKAFPSWASMPQLMYRYDTVICSFIHSAKLSWLCPLTNWWSDKVQLRVCRTLQACSIIPMFIHTYCIVPAISICFDKSKVSSLTLSLSICLCTIYWLNPWNLMKLDIFLRLPCKVNCSHVRHHWTVQSG